MICVTLIIIDLSHYASYHHNSRYFNTCIKVNESMVIQSKIFITDLSTDTIA